MKFKNGYYIAALWIVLLVGFKVAEKMEEKKYKVEFTPDAWQARYNWLEVAKQQIRGSDIPAKQALFVCDSLLGRFQQELAAQLQPQFAADTTTKKKTK